MSLPIFKLNSTNRLYSVNYRTTHQVPVYIPQQPTNSIKPQLTPRRSASQFKETQKIKTNHLIFRKENQQTQVYVNTTENLLQNADLGSENQRLKNQIKAQQNKIAELYKMINQKTEQIAKQKNNAFLTSRLHGKQVASYEEKISQYEKKLAEIKKEKELKHEMSERSMNDFQIRTQKQRIQQQLKKKIQQLQKQRLNFRETLQEMRSIHHQQMQEKNKKFLNLEKQMQYNQNPLDPVSVGQLQRQLSIYKSQLQQLERQLSIVNGQFGEISTEKDKQYNQLYLRFKIIQADNQTLKQEKKIIQNTKRREVDQINSNLNAVIYEKDSQIQQMTEQINRLSNQIVFKEKELISTKGQLKQKEIQINSQVIEISESKKKLQSMMEQLQEKIDENKYLQSALEHRINEIQTTMGNQIINLEKTLTNTQKLLEERDQSIKTLKKQLKTLKKVMYAKGHISEKVQSQLHSENTIKEIKIETCEILQGTENKRDNQKGPKKKDISNRLEDLQSVQRQENENQNIVEEKIKFENRRWSQEVSVYHKNLKSKEQQLHSQRQKSLQLQREFTQFKVKMQQEIQTLKDVIQVKNAQISNSKNQIIKIQMELVHKETEFEKKSHAIRVQLENSVVTNSVLEISNYKQLKQSYEALQQIHNDLKNRYTLVQSSFSALQDRFQQMKIKNQEQLMQRQNELINQNNDLLSHLLSSNSTISQLQSKLKKQQLLYAQKQPNRFQDQQSKNQEKQNKLQHQQIKLQNQKRKLQDYQRKLQDQQIQSLQQQKKLQEQRVLLQALQQKLNDQLISLNLQRIQLQEQQKKLESEKDSIIKQQQTRIEQQEKKLDWLEEYLLQLKQEQEQKLEQVCNMAKAQKEEVLVQNYLFEHMNNQLTIEKKNLEKQKAQLNQELSCLQEELKNINHKINSLQNMLYQIQNFSERFSQEDVDSSGNSHQGEGQLDHYLTEKHISSHSHKVYSESQHRIHVHHNVLTKQHQYSQDQQLKQHLSQMSARLEKQSKENSELKNQIKDLHQKIHILDQSNAFLKRQNASTLLNYQKALKDIAELRHSNQYKLQIDQNFNPNSQKNPFENNQQNPHQIINRAEEKLPINKDINLRSLTDELDQILDSATNSKDKVFNETYHQQKLNMKNQQPQSIEEKQNQKYVRVSSKFIVSNQKLRNALEKKSAISQTEEKDSLFSIIKQEITQSEELIS